MSVIGLSQKKREAECTRLFSKDLLFVPYSKAMIPRYCEWLSDKDLCKMTATEPMSPTEVAGAHRVWTTHADKVIFIVLDRCHQEGANYEMLPMIGDVNMVLKDADDNKQQGLLAEMMLMIAEPLYRRRGLGIQMMTAFMRYALDDYSVEHFEAHIRGENSACLALFEKLGFVKTGFDEIFQEYTLSYAMDENSKTKIHEQSDNLEYRKIVQNDPQSEDARHSGRAGQ